MTLRIFTADLHVHSLLSPCAEVEMTPKNIIAVASLANLSVVIVAGGTKLETETTARAVKEKVILCTTVLSAFEVVGRLYQLGIKGHDS